MNPLEILKEEHRLIERELLELETIMEELDINYSNLVHVWKNLYDLWNSHEEKEEKVFPIMEKERIRIPVVNMFFEHKELRGHKQSINKAIMSGSNDEIKSSLETHGRIIIGKLRQHINAEDEILYTIAEEELTPEESKEIEKILS